MTPKMLMMVLLLPGRVLGGCRGDPDGVNGSWEKACTYVSTPIRVRVAVAAGEYARLNRLTKARLRELHGCELLVERQVS